MLREGGGDVFISQFAIEGKVDLHELTDVAFVAAADDHYEERHLAPAINLPQDRHFDDHEEEDDDGVKDLADDVDVVVADDHYEERHLVLAIDLPKTDTCIR